MNSTLSDYESILSRIIGMENSTCMLILFVLLVIFWLFYLNKAILVNSSGLPIFISGCDTGLGNYLAIFFSNLGCDVYAGCLNPNESKNSLPESVTIVPLDICDENSVKNAVEQVKNSLKEKGKDLWALINNAGVCIYGYFDFQTWNQCKKQVEVNLLGTMRLTRAFSPLLRKSKGRIITITSVNGSLAYPGLSVYCATKFALEGFCHALRLEFRRQHGMNVIIFEPGDYAGLTQIMARHEQNAQEMWDNMTEEDREQFGEFFRKMNIATRKNCGYTSPRSIENSPLLKDMKDAVLNVNPRKRYISDQYKFFYCLFGLMPFGVTDGVLDLFTYKLLRSAQGSR